MTRLPIPDSIDGFFKPTSIDVARKLVGMEITSPKGAYIISSSKAYLGDNKHTQSKPRLLYGGIMVFNLRGHLHFCVSTGQNPEQDYVLIHKVHDGVQEIDTSSAVSKALGLTLGHDSARFSDYFSLWGMTQKSAFRKDKAETCIGIYELVR
ncbi:MAG TPA: hypothetical protein VJI75_06570 [Candidatus Nanoarchaeia archaeon]|nr:hypothetical protein [Candidatus Nanoarchaeia archaeon]